MEITLFLKRQQNQKGRAIRFWPRSKTVAAMACLKAFISF
jgi:hypothetical protein